MKFLLFGENKFKVITDTTKRANKIHRNFYGGNQF
jgi:hypothetical protein